EWVVISRKQRKCQERYKRFVVLAHFGFPFFVHDDVKLSPRKAAGIAGQSVAISNVYSVFGNKWISRYRLAK
ncbi:unnamed protein product, partial [marine sediment metagenome]